MHTLEMIFFILALVSSMPVIVISIWQWIDKSVQIDGEQTISVFVFWIATAILHYLRQ